MLLNAGDTADQRLRAGDQEGVERLCRVAISFRVRPVRVSTTYNAEPPASERLQTT